MAQIAAACKLDRRVHIPMNGRDHAKVGIVRYGMQREDDEGKRKFRSAGHQR